MSCLDLLPLGQAMEDSPKVLSHLLGHGQAWCLLAFLLGHMDQNAYGLFFGVFLASGKAHGSQPFGYDVHTTSSLSHGGVELSPIILGEVWAQLLEGMAIGGDLLLTSLDYVSHSCLDFFFGCVWKRQCAELGEYGHNALAAPLVMAIHLVDEAGHHALQSTLHIWHLGKLLQMVQLSHKVLGSPHVGHGLEVFATIGLATRLFCHKWLTIEMEHSCV